jgi:pyruvate formate lyase activating enzyme
MKIAAWQKESFIDYEGKLSTVVFTPNCNYNCGYCHNPELKDAEGKIDEKEIFDYLKSKKGKGWIDAVVITGGEPTIQNGLKDFVKEVKNLGFLVKLDTNGAKPYVLQELKNEKLLDYVAMDVKGPIELYPLITGKLIKIRDNISKGISIVSQFPKHEFRTTTCLIYEDCKPRWMTPKEIGDTAELIRDWALTKDEVKYILQPFKAIEKEEGDKRFMKKYIPKEFHETPKENLEEYLIEAQKHIPNTKIR